MLYRLLIIAFFTTMATFAQMPPIEPGVSHDLAIWRGAHYSDVRYKLNLTLEKMSPVLKGSMEIRVSVSSPHVSKGNSTDMQPQPGAGDPPPPIILDWRKIRGYEDRSHVTKVNLNGTDLTSGSAYDSTSEDYEPDQRDFRGLSAPRVEYAWTHQHLIFRDGVVVGENIIKLDFTSPILTSGSAITRYVDREDGAEYIYSLFVPSDASTAFPVFDQPDLKARFTLDLRTEIGWNVISNGERGRYKYECVAGGFCGAGHIFGETKPISTYVFAFAAGPFAEFGDTGDAGRNASVNERALDQQDRQPKPAPHGVTPASSNGTLVNTRVSARVFVRKSQAAKFKPHAAEVFRLTREGVKYLETYFDCKFPFPKYDLVLIPEFPFGGMEHAGATFLREASVIFPQEPTKNDFISRANLIFHETAHQWFGDTVTMKWFDDLWLKEGFAEFMAYKTLEAVMPEANAWKVFYERNKQAAYLTDSTKGTTPIYQEIANLSAAKSAYGNIVYRKAPSFLRQAEFYLGPDKFQTAVRAFLKKHEYANAGWEDLVNSFQDAINRELGFWSENWVKQKGLVKIRVGFQRPFKENAVGHQLFAVSESGFQDRINLDIKFDILILNRDGSRSVETLDFYQGITTSLLTRQLEKEPIAVFPNYQDYGYGIFLLGDKSRDYVVKNIGREKDDFLRTMMWGSLWDSVREGELDPKDYVELVVKNINVETDEGTIQTLLGRVSTAMRYYLPEPNPAAGGTTPMQKLARKQGLTIQPSSQALAYARASASDLQTRVEALLIDKMQNASTPGQRITYYRSFLSIASTERARNILKQILRAGQTVAGGNASVNERALTKSVDRVTKSVSVGKSSDAGGTLVNTRVSARTSDAHTPSGAPPTMRTKDRFDIVAKLITLGDPEAPKLLANLEKTETSDEARRYAYAARAGFATAENKAKYWADYTANKDISESWIESSLGAFNSVRQSDLSLPYLQKALAELPKLKRDRKIFFVNGWLGAFIGGQKSAEALEIVNKFLADNPDLDKDLRLKILENVDLIERAVRIRAKFGKS